MHSVLVHCVCVQEELLLSDTDTYTEFERQQSNVRKVREVVLPVNVLWLLFLWLFVRVITQEDSLEGDVTTIDATQQLLRACANGHTEVVHQLLSAGVSASVCDDVSASALLLATRVGAKKCVDALISAGADINAQDEVRTKATHTPQSHTLTHIRAHNTTKRSNYILIWYYNSYRAAMLLCLQLRGPII